MRQGQRQRGQEGERLGPFHVISCSQNTVLAWQQLARTVHGARHLARVQGTWVPASLRLDGGSYLLKDSTQLPGTRAWSPLPPLPLFPSCQVVCEVCESEVPLVTARRANPTRAAGPNSLDGRGWGGGCWMGRGFDGCGVRARRCSLRHLSRGSLLLAEGRACVRRPTGAQSALQRHSLTTEIPS